MWIVIPSWLKQALLWVQKGSIVVSRLVETKSLEVYGEGKARATQKESRLHLCARMSICRFNSSRATLKVSARIHASTWRYFKLDVLLLLVCFIFFLNF